MENAMYLIKITIGVSSNAVTKENIKQDAWGYGLP